MKHNKLKSIKLAERKETASCAEQRMPVPDEVVICMSQHIGAPCKPIVNAGDYVKVGQLIGEATAPVSAPIHSSVSGTVKSVEKMRWNNIASVDAVIIETDKKQEVHESVKPPVVNTREEFWAAVRASGMVGLGGAAFPTEVKYNPKNLDEVDTLIVNGAECEPYNTSDHRTMLENTDDVFRGINEVMKWLELDKCYIAIEANKQDAISLFQKIISENGWSKMEVAVLPERYPKGAEKVLIRELTDKHAESGILPADLGVLVSNVTTLANLGIYLRTGMPLVEKGITVSGSAIAEPKNILAPIGTRICDIVDFCGGYKEEPKKIIMGGPMMGMAVTSDAVAIVKNNNALLILNETDARLPEESACIKCGKCTSVCPFGLMPGKMAEAYERKDVETLKMHNVNWCMECGSCSYVCPARRPLSLSNKMSKILLREEAGK